MNDICFFFFFQAEDGIRDATVTGVQTCALPISSALALAAGWEPVDPMRRDFRGGTQGHEAEIVDGDLADIDSCDAVLAAFTAPDEGTAMEAWYAHARGVRVVVYTGGTPSHPWTRYVAESVHASLE